MNKKLPESVDLRTTCSPVVDQGKLGSATSCALVGAMNQLENGSYAACVINGVVETVMSDTVRLGKEFKHDVLTALNECQTLGYYPNRFSHMLATMSAISLAEKLISDGTLQSGLKQLAKMGRLDLAIETIVMKPKYESLFSLKFRDAATWRLVEAERLVKRFHKTKGT